MSDRTAGLLMVNKRLLCALSLQHSFRFILILATLTHHSARKIPARIAI
jgi:hypothetical protein